MIEYMEPSEKPVVAGSEDREVVYAKNQTQYKPLRTLVSSNASRAVLSRWTPTDEQRTAIADGKDIYLELLTFGRSLQPILMFIADDRDADEIKDGLWPQSHAVVAAATTDDNAKGAVNG